MAREEKRQCKKCEYAWYAVRAKPTKAPTRNDARTPMFDIFGDPAAKVARKQGRRNETMSAHERWAICPRCGSQKVRTVIGRFEPTGLAESRNAAAPTAPSAWTPPPASASAQVTPPPPTAATPPPSAASSADALALGTRVTLQIFGLRGKTGTVTGYGENGYTVKLDGGGTARRVPANKLTVNAG